MHNSRGGGGPWHRPKCQSEANAPGEGFPSTLQCAPNSPEGTGGQGHCGEGALAGPSQDGPIYGIIRIKRPWVPQWCLSVKAPTATVRLSTVGRRQLLLVNKLPSTSRCQLLWADCPPCESVVTQADGEKHNSQSPSATPPPRECRANAAHGGAGYAHATRAAAASLGPSGAPADHVPPPVVVRAFARAQRSSVFCGHPPAFERRRRANGLQDLAVKHRSAHARARWRKAAN